LQASINSIERMMIMQNVQVFYDMMGEWANLPVAGVHLFNARALLTCISSTLVKSAFSNMLCLGAFFLAYTQLKPRSTSCTCRHVRAYHAYTHASALQQVSVLCALACVTGPL